MKHIKVKFMQHTLSSVWRPLRGVSVIEVRPNLFKFQFFHPKEAQQVIDDGPWSFENNMLACRQLEPGEHAINVDLNTIEIWVLIFDLSNGYTSLTV